MTRGKMVMGLFFEPLRRSSEKHVCVRIRPNTEKHTSARWLATRDHRRVVGRSGDWL